MSTVGFVYFIQRQPDGPIKIGHAASPRQRLGFLQTGSVERLEMLCAVAGSLDDERAVHREFKSAGLRGEWFDPTPALLAFIASANLHGALPAVTVAQIRQRPLSDAGAQIISEIQVFLTRTGMSVTAFGRNACNDGKLLLDLRNGRRIWPETAEKVRSFMASDIPADSTPTQGKAA